MAGSFAVTVAAATLAVALNASLAPTVRAAEMPCASEDEARGFTLRHLQSRLMVAALSCNQKEAYNTFVQRFMTDLTSGGRSLTAYFARTGLGTPALNRHVTDLANAAGLVRTTDPEYCAVTWRTFWDLQQKPEDLVPIADASLMTAISLPRVCASQAAATLKPRKTAAPQEAKAAAP